MRGQSRTRAARTPKLDLHYCAQLVEGRSTCEIVAAPFRGQLRALLLERATMNQEIERLRAEVRRLETDNKRLAPAANALLEDTRCHSRGCVCPKCRAVHGTREIVRERVEEYRAKAGVL